MAEVHDPEAGIKLLGDNRDENEGQDDMIFFCKSDNATSKYRFKWLENFAWPVKIANAQLPDFYPNHINDELGPTTFARFVDLKLFLVVFILCVTTCAVVMLIPIAKVVGFKGLQFTIPAMSCSIFSMSLKLILCRKLEPLTTLFFMSKRTDWIITLLIPCLFIVTCTPYDYIAYPHRIARERNSIHNHNGIEVLRYKFTFIPIWIFMAILILIRYARLNMSLIYERRTFKYQNFAKLVINFKQYDRKNEVNGSQVVDWFIKLDKYISTFSAFAIVETILFGISFIALMSSFLLDGFLGPIDTCLAFTSVLLFMPSVYFASELNRTNKEVSQEYSYKFIGDSNVYSLSFNEVRMMVGLIITIVGAILNIRSQ